MAVNPTFTRIFDHLNESEARRFIDKIDYAAVSLEKQATQGVGGNADDLSAASITVNSFTFHQGLRRNDSFRTEWNDLCVAEGLRNNKVRDRGNQSSATVQRFKGGQFSETFDNMKEALLEEYPNIASIHPSMATKTTGLNNPILYFVDNITDNWEVGDIIIIHASEGFEQIRRTVTAVSHTPGQTNSSNLHLTGDDFTRNQPFTISREHSNRD